MNIKISSLYCLGVANAFLVLAACSDYTKVDEYPLPRHGGINTNNVTSSHTLSDISNPSTIGSGINTATNKAATNTGATAPTDISSLADSILQGSSSAVAPPTTPAIAPPKTSGAKYPYAIPVPGDPYHVISPYDNKKVDIRLGDGRPIPSGKVIRAKGETDPSRKFIIP